MSAAVLPSALEYQQVHQEEMNTVVSSSRIVPHPPPPIPQPPLPSSSHRLLTPTFSVSCTLGTEEGKIGEGGERQQERDKKEIKDRDGAGRQKQLVNLDVQMGSGVGKS